MKKGILRSFLSRQKMRFDYIFARSDSFADVEKNNRKVIFFLSADYGNIGDIAISYAQRTMLKEHYPDRIYIEVPISQTLSAVKSLRKKVLEDDVITMVGGGNMGDMYGYIENRRRLIISSFLKNEIISFPQTIDFSDTRHGKKELRRSKRIYSKHHRLTLMVRERKSFNLLKEHFKANSLLTPDVVLSLDTASEQKRETNRLVFCIRKDEEISISRLERATMINFFSEKYEDIIYQDTHVGDVKLTVERGLEVLESIWQVFRSADLVVTDRLHGMIFCALTKTPCIAVNNSNGKVKGVYDLWVKRLGGVVLLEDFTEKSMQEALVSVKKTSPRGTAELVKEFDVIKGELH